MISEQMKAEGWIEHDGGPCPVPLDSKPGIMWSDGTNDPKPNVAASFWTRGDDWWKHEGESDDCFIIAYKPEGHPNDH